MPEDKKNKKKSSKKDVLDMNPKLDSTLDQLRIEKKEDKPCWKGYMMVGTKKKNGKTVPNCVPEEAELSETLTRMGRIRLARSLKRSGKSGKLQRGKRRMAKKAMTATRAKGLGIRGSWRQMKQKIGGKSTTDMSAAQRSRVEKIAAKRKAQRSVLAKNIARSKLREDFVNEAFVAMIEGKRYHQLLNKSGKVNLDKRFKAFKNISVKEQVSIDELFDLFYKYENACLEEAAAISVESLYEETGSDIKFVADKFGVSFEELKRKLRG